jgi:acyl carrier protein
MTIETVREKLQEAFKNVGIIFTVLPDEDIDLQEYVEDSLQYITTIAEIENLFDIDLPDELLLFSSLSSFHSFSEAIFELLKEKD